MTFLIYCSEHFEVNTVEYHFIIISKVKPEQGANYYDDYYLKIMWKKLKLISVRTPCKQWNWKQWNVKEARPLGTFVQKYRCCVC